MRVEGKTALGTEGVLAVVALGAAGSFATLDDLLAVAVRTSDCSSVVCYT